MIGVNYLKQALSQVFEPRLHRKKEDRERYEQSRIRINDLRRGT